MYDISIVFLNYYQRGSVLRNSSIVHIRKIQCTFRLRFGVAFSQVSYERNSHLFDKECEKFCENLASQCQLRCLKETYVAVMLNGCESEA